MTTLIIVPPAPVDLDFEGRMPSGPSSVTSVTTRWSPLKPRAVRPISLSARLAWWGS